jgi:hypothetical protein
MRRRPLARAAVVGGGAYAIGKHSANKQNATNQEIQQAQASADEAQVQAQQAQQMAAQAPAAGGGGLSDTDIQKLKDLAGLHESGVLTDEEFEQQKKEILG